MSAVVEAVSPPLRREFFTPQEVASMTGFTQRHGLNLTKRGAFASVRFGHRVLIPVEEIDRLRETARASRT